MSKVILEVSDKHLSEVLVILKSLKTGMIQNIKIDPKKHSTEELLPEDTHLTAPKSGTSRYLSAHAFKEKLKK